MAAFRKIRFSRGKRKGLLSVPVIYLGNVEILCPVGDGICGSVQEIFENCGIKLKNNLLPKRILEIKDGSFELKPDGEVQVAPKLIYSFSKIIYCGVDGKRRKVLVFNYHHGSGDGREVYLTHAFMCETKTVAKKLAFAVAKYFESVKYVSAQEEHDNMGESSSSLLQTRTGDLESLKEGSADDIELGDI